MARKKNTDVLNLVKKSKEEKTPTTETVDEQVKERVGKLVDEVDLTTKTEDGLLEFSDDSTPTNEDLNNLEWLQDQLKKLSEENESLKYETTEAKENYKKIHVAYESLKSNKPVDENFEPTLIPDSQLKNGIVELFVDVQNNFQGRNPEKRRYGQIIPVPFMTKMIKMFPFLEEYKRF